MEVNPILKLEGLFIIMIIININIIVTYYYQNIQMVAPPGITESGESSVA